MPVARDQIKEEMQVEGFLKELKEEYNQNVEETGKKVIEKYEENNQEITKELLGEQFSQVFIDLIGYETDIFETLHRRVYPEALAHFLDEYYNSGGQVAMSTFQEEGNDQIDVTEYPATREALREVEKKFNTYDDFSELFQEIIPDLYYLIEPIVESADQSSVKRAGASFRNHFQNLLEIAGYNIRSVDIEGSGYLMHISAEGKYHSTEVHFGFHTTLKDRFRSSLGDVPEDIPQYIITASGVGAVADKDYNDITNNRLDEIRKSGATLVAVERAASQYPQRDCVISYEEFLNDSLPEHFK
jgi:hypothetical protein